MASWSLVWVDDDPHTWGGPRIRWADHRDPGATLFTLNDVTEKREWGSLHEEVGVMIRALTTVLSSLQDVVAPVGQI